ncbi:MAG: folylpolyglutamate synthase/dihydrofolate synthase family protein [Nitrospirota bacterium]
MSYQQTIEYLFGLQKHGIKFGLTNSYALMELMGGPHTRFRSAHIAGTNGKGSTAAFLAGMLRAAGRRVGLYTSPHLVSFTERIRINGAQISEGRVVELAERIRKGCRLLGSGEGPGPFSPTFFEVTTALAFTYFAEEGVDLAVVETGMGGRLDSTNVVTPLVSVITNIDLDHTEFLGNSLEEIAREKAGIIKRGIPVVTGASRPEAVGVIEGTAAGLSAPLYCLGRDFRAEHIAPGQPQSFDYQGIKQPYDALTVRMLGRHQIDNACLALAAAECMNEAGLVLPEAAMRRGLEQTAWEGRLERVSRKPDIYLDGAHNPASARALARTIGDMKREYRKVILVIGILADKDFRGILSELAPIADRVVVTKPQYSRAMDLPALAMEIRRLHDSVDTGDTVAKAVAQARDMASPDDLILIAGSLYVVGDARAALVQDAPTPGTLTGLKG